MCVHSSESYEYMQVQVSGKLSISFYDSEAGTKTLTPIKIAPRTSPELTEVDVDASNLPTGACCLFSRKSPLYSIVLPLLM